MLPEEKQALYVGIQMMFMKKRLGFSLLMAFFYFTVCAQVVVPYEPRRKVAMENTYIRLFNVRVLPGDTSLFHHFI
jgi:hypothetical protein